MSSLKCKSCGERIPINKNEVSVVCPSCGNLYDVPMDEKKEQYLNLYSKADDAWDHKDFEEAAELYQQILDVDNTQSEAHFGLVMCKYGITYEVDPVTQKKMPTCNRINRDSILSDKHYMMAVKHASKDAAATFEKRAKEIDRISSDFLKIVDKEPPYDVFISYKKTADDGSLTQDSKVARKLYFHLKERGMKVFFAEETLKSVAGEKYEPYIFAALSSAPVMILVGSKRDHFDATWVKNEWRRYLVLMNQGLRKTLIPAYFDMDPYHLPGELRSLHALNAADITFHEDVTDIIRKKLADAKEGQEPGEGKPVTLRDKYAPKEKVRAVLELTDCDREFAINVLVQCHGDVNKSRQFIEEDPDYKKSLWVCAECKSKNTHDNCRNCGITKTESIQVARARKEMEERQRKKSAEYKRQRAENLKKLRIPALILAALLLVAGIVFGVTSCVNNNKVAAVEELIAKIPVSISDYSLFEKEIEDAYIAYSELDPSLQEKVSNRDALLNCMAGFNQYRAQQIRTTMEGVTLESVQSTDVLARLYGYYSKINNEQRALLNGEEFSRLEQYAHTYLTINGINELMGDVVGKYDTLAQIRANYSKLQDEYKALVYNYGLLDNVDAIYNLHSSLVFTEANGGWSVSVKPENKTVLSGDILVPDTYQGKPVTTIPKEGFAGCTRITSVVVPNSVTNIGYAAFSGCANISSITLPFVGLSRTGRGSEGLFGDIFGTNKYDGGTATKQYYASYDNKTYYLPGQLRTVTITDATQLGYGAFYNCSMLTEINLNDGIMSVGAHGFRNCSGITEINLPKITTISQSMFEGCSELISFTINDSVTEIGSYAFKGCIALSRINSDTEGEFVIKNNIQKIGYEAFNGCIKLQSITLPFVGLSKTGSGSEGLFGDIFGTTSYTGGTATKQYYASYDNKTYYLPGQLRTVTITDATQLSYGAFYNCSMLTEINLNDGIIGAGPHAFHNCSNITQISLPSITTISLSTFEGCSSLTSFDINTSVTSIGAYAFKGCMALSRINSTKDGEFIISNNIQSIGAEAFNGCITLKSITLPFVGASKTASGAEGLFGYIFGTTSYTGGTVAKQYYATYDYKNYYIPSQLKTVVITDANKLSYGAFYNCSMLTKVKINSDAKSSVGTNAFTNCVSPNWT